MVLINKDFPLLINGKELKSTDFERDLGVIYFSAFTLRKNQKTINSFRTWYTLSEK